MISPYSSLFEIILWSSMTVFCYILAKKINHRLLKWWSAPVILTPLFLAIILLVSKTTYHSYFLATSYISLMVGPATVAFAVPIYEKRAIIFRYYKILLLAVSLGSLVSMFLVFLLCDLLALDEVLFLSLLPRSVTTPFAITIATEIGGKPELTAIFVAVTGIFGSVIGEIMLYTLPLRSKLARGVAFGVAAHAIGSNKAYQIDEEEGVVAALAMILVGILNILAAPLIIMVL